MIKDSDYQSERKSVERPISAVSNKLRSGSSYGHRTKFEPNKTPSPPKMPRSGNNIAAIRHKKSTNNNANAASTDKLAGSHHFQYINDPNTGTKKLVVEPNMDELEDPSIRNCIAGLKKMATQNKGRQSKSTHRRPRLSDFIKPNENSQQLTEYVKQLKEKSKSKYQQSPQYANDVDVPIAGFANPFSEQSSNTQIHNRRRSIDKNKSQLDLIKRGDVNESVDEIRMGSSQKLRLQHQDMLLSRGSSKDLLPKMSQKKSAVEDFIGKKISTPKTPSSKSIVGEAREELNQSAVDTSFTVDKKKQEQKLREIYKQIEKEKSKKQHLDKKSSANSDEHKSRIDAINAYLKTPSLKGKDIHDVSTSSSKSIRSTSAIPRNSKSIDKSAHRSNSKQNSNGAASAIKSLNNTALAQESKHQHDLNANTSTNTYTDPSTMYSNNKPPTPKTLNRAHTSINNNISNIAHSSNTADTKYESTTASLSYGYHSINRPYHQNTKSLNGSHFHDDQPSYGFSANNMSFLRNINQSILGVHAENESLEDMHLLFVAFYQKAKHMVEKVENTRKHEPEEEATIIEKKTVMPVEEEDLE